VDRNPKLNGNGRGSPRGKKRRHEGSSNHKRTASTEIDFDSVTPAAQLMPMGIEVVSAHLARCGLKVGGGLADRCARLAACTGGPEQQAATCRGKNLSNQAKRCMAIVEADGGRRPSPAIVRGHLVWVDPVRRLVFHGTHLTHGDTTAWRIGTMDSQGSVRLEVTLDETDHGKDHKQEAGPVKKEEQEGPKDKEFGLESEGEISVQHPFPVDADDHWYVSIVDTVIYVFQLSLLDLHLHPTSRLLAVVSPPWRRTKIYCPFSTRSRPNSIKPAARCVSMTLIFVREGWWPAWRPSVSRRCTTPVRTFTAS
jgi:hypothetical protein